MIKSARVIKVGLFLSGILSSFLAREYRGRGEGMEKRFQVCGLGNAIVDLLCDVGEEEFSRRGLERGTMRLVSVDEQAKILESLSGLKVSIVSGGSVANSLIAISQLGGRSAFIGCVGDDRYGLHYQEEFLNLGIEFANPPVHGAATGTSLIMITPDAERTMRTCLAVSADLSDAHVDEEIIAKSEWLFIEGYVFTNSSTGQRAIAKAVEAARRWKTKIALTCSEAWVVQNFEAPFRAALAQADLVFANESEACALVGADSFDSALPLMKAAAPNFVATAGERGAFFCFDGHEGHAPAIKCVPRDLTGAGDMLAGAFLYGITNGYGPERSANAACALAGEVITRVGARLHSGAAEIWRRASAG